MIGSMYIAMYVLLLWSMFANTEFEWLSFIFFPIIFVCQIVSYIKYENLLARIDKLEEQKKGGE